jgi:dienelactone hydrolase
MKALGRLLLAVAAAASACRPPGPAREAAAACTHLQAERQVRGLALCEDEWTCARPPGGRFDRVGLHRLAPCEGSAGPVVLYLPGMHMNGTLPFSDARHDLRLYLAQAGIRTWGLSYRTHSVPPEATPGELAALEAWTARVFVDDAAWAAGFVRGADHGPLVAAGFSYGAGVAYRLATREPVAGLVILDGAADGGRAQREGSAAIDVGSSRLPFAERQQLLERVLREPGGPAADTLADILYTAAAFGGNGGLANTRDGVSDARVLARLLLGYDRWWPRAALDRSPAEAPAAPIPVLAFASANMGPQWVERVRASAQAFGGEGALVRELRGYGHLDVLAGRGAPREVFEPVRAWIAGR